MDKQYQPTLTEVQDWVLKLYNTCEQTNPRKSATGRYSPNVSRLSLTSTVSPNF